MQNEKDLTLQKQSSRVLATTSDGKLIKGSTSSASVTQLHGAASTSSRAQRAKNLQKPKTVNTRDLTKKLRQGTLSRKQKPALKVLQHSGSVPSTNS